MCIAALLEDVRQVIKVLVCGYDNNAIVKLDAIVTFLVPFLVFALPLLDTSFAFARRILTGRSPFSADRGHLHHRLIDKGFDQRHSVMILYAVTGISGISAILISIGNYVGGAVMLGVAFAILFLNLFLCTGKGIIEEAKQSSKNTDDTQNQ